MESGAALILLLYTGTKDEPVDWRNVGYGYNIPVYRNRLQRIFNRAIHEAKINLLCNVSDEHHLINGFTTGKSRALWTEGLINPITRKIPTVIRKNLLMEEEEALAAKVVKFGKGSAGASLTKLQHGQTSYCETPSWRTKRLTSNDLTDHRSLAILDKTGPKHAMATCQIKSRNPANKERSARLVR